MVSRDGVPWQPPPLDELLDDPFEQIEHQQGRFMLLRLDEMTRQLEDIEEELDAMLLEFSECL